ncbi:MAG: DUF4384 domain-containing protein [Polyangiaceae bacterium]|nr:DUF4384 domain-containing protein [Polyangiaceae bacterium]
MKNRSRTLGSSCRLGLAVLLAGLGCASGGGTAVTGAPTAAEAQPVAVRLRGSSYSIKGGALDEGSRKALRQGGSLRSGDAFELTAELDAPAHVYVMQFLPDGTAAVLHPLKGKDAALPSGTHRIPVERDDVFQLDERPGAEILYVIVSKGPLPSAEKQLVDEVRALPKDAIYPVAYEVVAEDRAEVEAFHDRIESADPGPAQSATATATTTATATATPLAAHRGPQRACAPDRVQIGLRAAASPASGMKARGGCEASVAPRKGLKARAVKRLKLGEDLAAGATEGDGVATFVLRIDHRP